MKRLSDAEAQYRAAGIPSMNSFLFSSLIVHPGNSITPFLSVTFVLKHLDDKFNVR
jgi:hypothetical protein